MPTKKLDKMYNVIRISRADLLELGISEKKALAVTDEQMIKMARGMADGYMPEYWECLEIVYDYVVKKK